MEIKLSLGWRDFADLVRGECLIHRDKEIPVMIKIELSEREPAVLHALINRVIQLRAGDSN